ncbi:helix-turn-helix domain-containing protein, partial [Burkholderia pseudomallei]
EVARAVRVHDTPAARLVARGPTRARRLDEVAAWRASASLVVDACPRVVHDARATVTHARRPVLFARARALGEPSPGDAP